MLNFSDQPYQYFPPKRNSLVAWLLGIYNRRVFLPRVKLVNGVAVSGELDALDQHEQLRQAVAAGIVTAEEAEELEAVRAMVTEVITVDEFDSEELKLGAREREVPPTDQAA